MRDPYKATARNEFQDRWDGDVGAGARVRHLRTTARRILLLNGPPAVPHRRPLHHRALAASRSGSSRGATGIARGVHRRLLPQVGRRPVPDLEPARRAGRRCSRRARRAGRGGHSLARDRQRLPRRRPASPAPSAGCAARGMEYDLLQRAHRWPSPRTRRRVDRLLRLLLDRRAGRGRSLLPAKLDVDFPGRHQNRTVVQGLVLTVATARRPRQLARAPLLQLAGQRRGPAERRALRQLPLQVRLPGRLPDRGAGRPLAAPRCPVFQRHLRPGDVQADRQGRGPELRQVLPRRAHDHRAGVGRTWPRRPRPRTMDAETPACWPRPTPRIVERRDDAASSSAPRGELQTGHAALRHPGHRPSIDKVTFALDGKPVLTKKKPALQRRARPRHAPAPPHADRHGLRRGRRRAGERRAADQRRRQPLPGPPGRAAEAASATRAACSPAPRSRRPTAQTVERVEIYLNETLVATLYQPPY